MTLLENIYNKVQLSVFLTNGITNPFTSSIGLKQCCNLSPILFNLFINDINDIFHNSMCQPPKIYQLTLNNLLYPDDLVLLSETRLGLQNCLTNYSSTATKTKTMIIAKRQLAMASSLTFNGNVRETCKSYPYLGSLISSHGQFKVNINELCKSASRAIYTPLGNVNKFLSGNTRQINICLYLFP